MELEKEQREQDRKSGLDKLKMITTALESTIAEDIMFLV